jgi:hypothetical protein
VQALALAYPHLARELAARAKERAKAELAGCLRGESLPLDKGRRRELFDVPPHDLTWSYHPSWPQVSHLYAVWLYGERTGDWDSVKEQWQAVRLVWQNYAARPLEFDTRQGGHLYLNRTAAGCLAYARLARRFDDTAGAEAATRELGRLTKEALRVYRERARVADETLRQPAGKGDVAGNSGRKLYFHLNNHKSKLALFLDLSPELASALAAAAPAETAVLRRWVERLMPAWYLALGERAVHYGENFVDLPDTIHGLFLAQALLWRAPREPLSRYADLPWSRADLFHVEKLARAIEAAQP